MWLPSMKADMNPRDRINKASFSAIEKTKRYVSAALQELMRTGRLKIERRELPGLVYIIHAAIDAGYQEGHTDLMKSVDSALNDGKTKNVVARLFGKKK